MIYFEDWWDVGENCIEIIYSGMLINDKKIDDICISNEESLNKFKEWIAINILQYDSQSDKYISHKNEKDVFLNNKVNIDFNKNLLFIFPNAQIKQILYSQIYQCYMITFSEENVEENFYSAALVKKKVNDSKDIKFHFMNEKPKTKIIKE
jgi:hypothetical protein